MPELNPMEDFLVQAYQVISRKSRSEQRMLFANEFCDALTLFAPENPDEFLELINLIDNELWQTEPSE